MIKATLPIETERLLIREILPTDEQGMFELFGIGRWAVIQKKDGAFAGWTGFRFIPEHK